MNPSDLNLAPPPPVTLVATRPLRDPHGCEVRYDNYFRSTWRDVSEGCAPTIATELGKLRRGEKNYFHSAVLNNMNAIIERAACMYGRGDELSSIVDCLKLDLPYMERLRELYVGEEGEAGVDASRQAMFDCCRWNKWAFFAMLLLTCPDGAQLERWLSFFRGDAAQRKLMPENHSYYLHLILKAFSPDWPVLHNKHTMPTRSKLNQRPSLVLPLFRALGQADQPARTRALAQYMAGWNRAMKPFGWKPKRTFPPLKEDGTQVDPSLDSDWLFKEFAFEAALAACAFDLDDSGFRDHPYYPRELVDHYRQHIRHTRDAWRPEGAGPGIAFDPPAPPPKLDLARSKSKGLARWLELASGGDADAVGAVLDQVGRLRKVKDTFELCCALAENGAGLCADIKDDATLASQIDALLESRALQGWGGDSLPGAGPDRCSAMLLALDQWLSDRPWRLWALGGEDDAWQGVLAPREFDAEFAELSQNLGLKLQEPRQAWGA